MDMVICDGNELPRLSIGVKQCLFPVKWPVIGYPRVKGGPTWSPTYGVNTQATSRPVKTKTPRVVESST